MTGKPILRIGRLPYTNLFPIFHVLRSGPARYRYEFVEGYPSSLNRLVREGAIDVSPSSSIEYLRDESRYAYIEGHSISSHGVVKSILLLSRTPMESLAGADIAVTHQSETSVALLKVILSEFYGISASTTSTDMPVLEAVRSGPAYLSIGDDALLLYWKTDCPIPGYSSERRCELDGVRYYVYDLGELWQRHTGLPFVFALWIARKDRMESLANEFRQFTRDLDEAHRTASLSLEEIARASDNLPLPPEELVSYWNEIDYGLTEDSLKGLALFKRYLEKYGLLS